MVFLLQDVLITLRMQLRLASDRMGCSDMNSCFRGVWGPMQQAFPSYTVGAVRGGCQGEVRVV